MCAFCGLSRIISDTLQSRLFILGYGKNCRENDDLMLFQILCNTRVTHVKEIEEEEEEYGSLSEGGWVLRAKGDDTV